MTTLHLIPSSITAGTGATQRSETFPVIQGPPLSEEMLRYLEREEELADVDPRMRRLVLYVRNGWKLCELPPLLGVSQRTVERLAAEARTQGLLRSRRRGH